MRKLLLVLVVVLGLGIVSTVAWATTGQFRSNQMVLLEQRKVRAMEKQNLILQELVQSVKDIKCLERRK